VNVNRTKYMVMSGDQVRGEIKIKRLIIFSIRGRKCSNSGRNEEKTEVRELLLSFSVRCFVFSFPFKKFKDQDIQKYKPVCCLFWV